MKLVFFLIYILSCSFSHATWTPVVLMHGINANKDTMNHVVDVLKKTFPGIYVHNSEVGNGKEDSIFWNMNHQVEAFCSSIRNDSNLSQGFNLMGVSQGGLIARGYLERCNQPPVKNFISWVSPQAGQFGVPSLGNYTILDELIDCCVYDSLVQDIVAPSNYWKDPWQNQEYLENAIYLPDINNEREKKNELYKKNMLSLDSFSMSYSSVDTTLVPKETGWFEFYAPNQRELIVSLNETKFWIEDYIGLRALAEQNKLHRFVTNCEHQDYFSECFDNFFLKHVVPFLNNTLA